MRAIKLLLCCLMISTFCQAQTDQGKVLLIEPTIDTRLEMLLRLDKKLLDKGGWDKETLKAYANPSNEKLYEHLTDKLGKMGLEYDKQVTDHPTRTAAYRFMLQMEYEASINEEGAIGLAGSFTLIDKEGKAVVINASLHKALKELKHQLHQ